MEFTNSRYRFVLYFMGDEIVLQSYDLENNPIDVVYWDNNTTNLELIHSAIEQLKLR